jgi:hypothetical protein
MKVTVKKDFTHKHSAKEMKGKRSVAGDVLELSDERAK